jgi:hydrogenase maturation factor
MCLTIPKKVISVIDNVVVVELPDGSRQEVKTIVKLSVGDYCINQQNIIIEKMGIDSANELLELMNERRKI